MWQVPPNVLLKVGASGESWGDTWQEGLFFRVFYLSFKNIITYKLNELQHKYTNTLLCGFCMWKPTHNPCSLAVRARIRLETGERATLICTKYVKI